MTTTQDMLDLAKDYAAVFADGAGKRVLDDLKRRAFFGQTVLVGAAGAIDVPQSMMREGKRTLLLEILAQVEIGKRGLPEPASALAALGREP